MSRNDAMQALAWWAGAGQDLDAALARIGHHPELPAAVAALANGMLAATDADRALDGLCKDAGRYAGVLGVFVLHETEGLTLPRLKALGAATGMLSPGRARLLIQMLEHLKFAEPAGREGRATRYALTDRFMAVWLGHLRAAITAALVLEPGVAALLEAPGDAAIRAFGRIHAGALQQTTAGKVDFTATSLTIFRVMHAHAGSHILWALLTSSRDGAFPPKVAGPVTIAGLARRFNVSRIHVRRVFDEGAQVGVTLADDGRVTFTPEVGEQLRFVWAIQLSHILMAAAGVAKELGLAQAA